MKWKPYNLLNGFCQLSFILVALLFLSAVDVPDGEQMFRIYCSACHTINKGKLIGPDLAGVEKRRDYAWIKRFIRSSQTVIQSGDPVAVSLFREYNQIQMPDQPSLTNEQVDAILDYIKRIGNGNETPSDLTATTSNKPGQPVRERNEGGAMLGATTQEDSVRLGRDLFSGAIHFKSGGPPCMACHNVTADGLSPGGKFAPDLTNVYDRIDENVIMETATSSIYPSMLKSYENNPITREEAMLLAAFFKYASAESAYQKQRDRRASDLMNRIKQNSQE